MRVLKPIVAVLSLLVFLGANYFCFPTDEAAAILHVDDATSIHNGGCSDHPSSEADHCPDCFCHTHAVDIVASVSFGIALHQAGVFTPSSVVHDRSYLPEIRPPIV